MCCVSFLFSSIDFWISFLACGNCFVFNRIQDMRQNELPKLSADLSKLNALYARLVHDGRTDQAGTLQKSIDAVNNRWASLGKAASAATQDLEQAIETKHNFDVSLQAVKDWLSDLDRQLTAAESFETSRLKDVLLVSFVLAANSGYCILARSAQRR
jgi:hypothetical protein